MPPKLTQPLRPAARYRPGKAPVPVADSDSDSGDDGDNAQQQGDQQHAHDDDEDEDLAEFSAPRTSKQQQPGAINVALRQVEVLDDGKVRVAGRDESGRTQMESSEGEYGALSSCPAFARACRRTAQARTHHPPDPSRLRSLARRDRQRGRSRSCGTAQACLSPQGRRSPRPSSRRRGARLVSPSCPCSSPTSR